MSPYCTVQLFSEGVWHEVAEVALWGDLKEGWGAKTYSGYSSDWVVAHQGSRDAHALSCQYPVTFEPIRCHHWPVFLIDMLPQGYGREELLRRLEIPMTANARADWQLLMAGAGNPIGNLRIKEAAEWLGQHRGSLKGFSDEEVAYRSEDFAEYLATHGLFVAGSSGVQGEWPKILLTRAEDGLLYLDHDLPDSRACAHYIVKFGRGRDQDLATILRHEAPYMNAAKLLGLRVHAPLTYSDRALFIPRFDRVVVNGKVERLAQESIASLTGKSGFTTLPSHEEVCRALMLRCTNPSEEVIEYLKRDVVNLALGNKDNHAINTALQRNFAGTVQLSPLYDFVPMYLHPDGIARRIRWEVGDGIQLNWSKVIERLCCISAELEENTGRRPGHLDRERLVNELKGMGPILESIAQHGQDMGFEAHVADHVRWSIYEQVRQLDLLQ